MCDLFNLILFLRVSGKRPIFESHSEFLHIFTSLTWKIWLYIWLWIPCVPFSFFSSCLSASIADYFKDTRKNKSSNNTERNCIKSHLSSAGFQKHLLQSFGPVMVVVNTFSREPSKTPGKLWLMWCGSIVFQKMSKKHLMRCIWSTASHCVVSTHCQFVSICERLSGELMQSISIILCSFHLRLLNTVNFKSA